jgi:hypothetical protein
LVHPHIEVAFEAIRKAPGCLIELVTADAKISEDAVHGSDFMQSKEPTHIAKVMGQELDARVVGQIGPRIFILIEGEESAIRPEPFQNTP